MKTILGCMVLAMPFLAMGCAAPSKESAFGDVRKTIADRTSYTIHWTQGSAEDAQAAAAVRQLLSRPLSADGAVQVALLNSRRLEATFEEIGIAQADLVQAGLLKNPIFDFSVRFPDRKPFGTYIDISAAEDFLSIILIPAKRKLAEAQLEQAKARVTDEVLALAANAKIAFYQYQSAEQLVEVRQTVAEAAADSLDAARRLHDAGNIGDLALLTEQAQGSRARVEWSTARADAQEAREKLNALMGLWGEQTAWNAGNRLPDLPADEVSPLGLETLAVERREDLTAARHEVLTQARMLGLTEQTRWLGEANLGVEGEHETDGQWRIGPSLSVPLPLFDHGQAAIPRAQAQFRMARQRYYALAVEARSQVRSARARMFHAREKAQFYRDEILPVQGRLVEESQRNFNGMFLSIFQLLQARRDQIDAGREYVESLRDYWVARSELERAVGGRLPAGQPPATGPVGGPTTHAMNAAPETMPTTTPTMPAEHHHHAGH